MPHWVYLVTTATFDRVHWFTDLAAGRIVVRAMKWLDDAGATETLAYVVMPDHLHWLFLLTSDRDLSNVVGSMKKFSARQIKRRFGRRDRLWQPGFHDHAIRREEDIEHLANYVVQNPVRAGMVISPGDYSLWDAPC